MIGLTHGLKVFLCTAPADMRRSFDGLSGMTASIIQQDPLSGHLFVFRNRNLDRLKILYWDRDGLAIWNSVWRREPFSFPPTWLTKIKEYLAPRLPPSNSRCCSVGLICAR